MPGEGTYLAIVGLCVILSVGLSIFAVWAFGGWGVVLMPVIPVGCIALAAYLTSDTGIPAIDNRGKMGGRR